MRKAALLSSPSWSLQLIYTWDLDEGLYIIEEDIQCDIGYDYGFLNCLVTDNMTDMDPKAVFDIMNMFE